MGLCPFIRPSVRTGVPSIYLREGWAGGPVCRPYGVYRSCPSFFVGAGHWPARRCTRRAESWFRPVSLALAGQFTFSRPTGCRDLHGRPHGTAPTKWVATCPLIRLAFARHLPPKVKAFGRLIAVLSFRRGRSQTGPREGHTPGWLLSAFGRFTFSPSPTGFKDTLSEFG